MLFFLIIRKSFLKCGYVEYLSTHFKTCFNMLHTFMNSIVISLLVMKQRIVMISIISWRVFFQS